MKMMNGKLFRSLISALCFLVVAGGSEVYAASKVAEVDGVAYNVSHSMVDNLKALKGKKVSVTIDSGKVMAGSVKEVGELLLHLEKLEGKDYFDALIRIEEISAIDTRFREIKR